MNPDHFHIITTCIQRMGEGYVLSLFTPGRYTHPVPMGGGCGMLIQPDRRVPHSSSLMWGYPHPAQWWRLVSHPAQWQGGYPGQASMGYPPPHWNWMGVPPSPKTEQQSEYLLRDGQYASCVHAGGLSCCVKYDEFCDYKKWRGGGGGGRLWWWQPTI